MKRTPVGLTFAVAFCLAVLARAADAPPAIDLWPGKVPGETPKTGEEKFSGKAGSRNLTNVTKPTITVFRPAKETNTGAAVGPHVLLDLAQPGFDSLIACLGGEFDFLNQRQLLAANGAGIKAVAEHERPT